MILDEIPDGLAIMVIEAVRENQVMLGAIGTERAARVDLGKAIANMAAF